MQGDQMTKVIGTPGVAAFLDHDVQPAGRQRRKLRQGRADEGQIGVDAGRARRNTRTWQTRLRQDTPDGAMMDAQLGGDGADAPALGMVVAQNLRFRFSGNAQLGFLFDQVRWRMEPGSYPGSPA
jgi:hypothetical protein